MATIGTVATNGVTTLWQLFLYFYREFLSTILSVQI